MTLDRQPLDYSIRRGRVSDVGDSVRLHQIVFDRDTHLATRLGARFIAAAYRWYVESPETFTYVADSGGRAVGVITVGNGPYELLFRRNKVALIVGVATHPRVLFEPEVRARAKALLRSRPQRKPASSEPDRRAYLGFLAVDERYRGKGTSAALLRAATAECRHRGWTTVYTSVHRKNAPVRFMYATNGFKERPSDASDDRVIVELTLALNDRPE